MASISLPFGLTRPSPTESVTNATEIDDEFNGSTKSQHDINEYLRKLAGSCGGGTGGGLGHVASDGSYSVVVLTPLQGFKSQLTSENTVYVIQDVFDLEGEVVWMKNNTTLWFYGGMLKNGCIRNINGNTKKLFHTKVICTGNNVCFEDVLLFGQFEGTLYDWMFKDTVRDDDYLMLFNLFQGVSSEIVKKKILNIKTWQNPYADKYILTPTGTGTVSANQKCILTYAGYKIDGHGACVNILMNDEEKFEQCGTLNKYSDGTVYAVSIACAFVRTQMQFNETNAKAQLVNNDIEILNLNIIDDKAANGKGADLTKYEISVTDDTDGTVYTMPSHQNMIQRTGACLGSITIKNIKYRGRFQFFGGAYGVEDKGQELPDFRCENCDLEVLNYFVFELYPTDCDANVNHARAIIKNGVLTWKGYGVAFSHAFYDNCKFTGQVMIASNGSVRDKEIWTNCIVERGSAPNETMTNVLYQYNNCVFKQGSWSIYNNGFAADYEFNDCILRCDELQDRYTLSEGDREKCVNSYKTTTYNRCSFVCNADEVRNKRCILSVWQKENSSVFNNYFTDNKLVFNDCTIQLPTSESFRGIDYVGQFIVNNCTIIDQEGVGATFKRSSKMMVNVTDGSNIEYFKRNPRTIDINNKNSTYRSAVLGWNYLTSINNTILVGDKLVLCDNKSFSLINSDSTIFYGNILSVSALIDFPMVGFKLTQVYEANFKLSFNIGNYTVVMQNLLAYDTLTLTITNNQSGQNYKVAGTILDGLHNYTFTLSGDNAYLFIDDKRVTLTNMENFSDLHPSTNFGGNMISTQKLTVGNCCGVKQIIIRPFGIF